MSSDKIASCRLAASSVAERYNFPMVSGSAAAAEICSRGYRNIFQVDTPADRYIDLVIESVKNAGLSRVALAYSGADFPRKVARGVRAKVLAVDLTLVSQGECPEDSTEFADLIAHMKATRPDVVIGTIY